MACARESLKPLNKRAHPRYAIQLNALVRVGDTPPCAATVRDFCLGGMFLALAPEEIALLSPPGRPLPRDTRLTVELALTEDGKPSVYRLDAKVARVLEQGPGRSSVEKKAMMCRCARPAA